jgi:hypothetical protein
MGRDGMLARVQSAADEHTKQRQLAMRRVRAIEPVAETRAHNLVKDIKAGFEQRKRNVFAAVAGAFRRFYDGKRELEENEFQRLLARTQNEIARLSAQG